LRLFLSSGEEHALICEDDVAFKTDPARIVKRLLNHAGSWDIARLSGLKEATGVNAFSLEPGYFLRVNFGRLKGAGAYLLNRQAAQKITAHLLPMRVPFDHAIDREWVYGLKAVSVSPFPIDQCGTGFRTSIQCGATKKLSTFRRFCFTYPYQVLNEVSRCLFRIPRALALCFGRTIRSSKHLTPTESSSAGSVEGDIPV
jgi:glycosyl transferase family 25